MPAPVLVLALALGPGGLLACPEPCAVTPAAAVYRAEQAGAGVVLGDSVNLRAGPGTAYEVVGRLGGGERVAVLGEAFGWLLVRPASPVKVYVAADLVERKAGGIAAVRRDRVNLRSRPALEATVIGQAGRGDVVRLLDEADASPGGFVAIEAPADVALYVHRDLVRLVDGEAGCAPALAAGSPLEGADPPAAPAAPGPTSAEKALRARDLYLAELEKSDLADMDFGPALALYEAALREAATEETRALARAGRKRVRIALALQEDYRRRMGPIERMVGGEREPCAPK
jgi:hypothetical protein